MNTKPADSRAFWPGTRIIKSSNTAFTWQGASSAILSAHVTWRSPLYNKWLTARADAPIATKPWPQYRDANTMPARRGPKKAGGIAANNGTMHGLTPRADKLLAFKPGAIHSLTLAKPAVQITRPADRGITTTGSDQQRAGLVDAKATQQQHGGAYSKAAAA